MPMNPKYESLAPFLDERMRRLWAATEAAALGRGGISQVSRATGLSRATIQAGLHELKAFREDPNRGLPPGRIRRAGAGRVSLTQKDPLLLAALEQLIDPLNRGDAASPLRWTCKSTAVLAEELQKKGRRVSVRSVASLLQRLGYRLRGLRGGRGDRGRRQRNAQFEYLNALIADFQERDWPVIAVEANRQEWIAPPRGHNGAGLVDGEGVWTAGCEGPGDDGHSWVNRDPSPFTIEWTVEAIRRWWRQIDSQAYPAEAELLVTVDLGEGDGPRLWGAGLQGLADQIGRRVVVSHLPPGTIKWNTPEQRIVASHTMNRWPAQPWLRHEAVLNVLTPAPPAEARSPDAEDGRCAPDVEPIRPLPRWNYTLVPRGGELSD